MPTTVSPHDFQATPGDLVRLQKADVLVKNGLGLETFLDKLIVNADNSGLQVIDSSAGIPTLENTEKDAKDPRPCRRPRSRPRSRSDQSPRLARSPPRRPAGGHHPRWPDRREARLRRAVQRQCPLPSSMNSRSLNAELASQLKPFAGKTFVAYHDFAPYFAERYPAQGRLCGGVSRAESHPGRPAARPASWSSRPSSKTLLSEPQEGRQILSMPSPPIWA